MIHTYRTKSLQVLAIQFDGQNLAELEVAVKEVCDREAFFAPMMEVGCWLLLTPPIDDRPGVYQVLPNKVFTRVHELDPNVAPIQVQVPRKPVDVGVSCFACVHYRPAQSHCTMFDADIDSEILAAEDCEEFRTETP